MFNGIRPTWICQSCRQHLRKRITSAHTPRSQTQVSPISNIAGDRPDIPTFAPQRVVATKNIRENVELHAQNCIDRNYKEESTFPAKIKALADKIYDLENEAKARAALRKELVSKSGTKPSEDDLPKLQEYKRERKKLSDDADELKKEMMHLAVQMPNITHNETPRDGIPIVLRYLNKDLLPVSHRSNIKDDQAHDTPAITKSTPTKSHVEIGKELNLLDFTVAATTSGWGWYFLLNEAVLLEQALVQYALHTAYSRGWTLVTPPSIVYSHISSACGFRPRDQNGEQQIYTLSSSDSTGSQGRTQEEIDARPLLSLAGTAEIPLAGMYANSTTDLHALPHKMIGVSRCYRAEAGGRGAATKGLYRVHEFTKVELFAWCEADQEVSDDIYNEMISLQEHILTSLGLPCRVLNMPSQDLGASAHRKVDIEAFMPSRVDVGDTLGWGEVTSVSECLDYQARRLMARYKPKKKPVGRDTEYMWSLNGTAVAVPRVLLALLEHGWDEERREMKVPEVLQKWMGGVEVIKAKQ